MNRTMVREFILLGFTDNHEFEIFIFVVLFGTYILTVMENMIIIMITLVDHHLYTPMYFFLRHFALLEIGLTTSVIPKTLANMAMGCRSISKNGCLTQSFLYFVFGTTEFFLLAVMSVDRYVAICNPLRYPTIMHSQVCSLLVLGSWLAGFIWILGPGVGLMLMPFCGPNTINHFFCDNGPLIKLACFDTTLLEIADFLTATLSLIGTLTITIVSYVNIVSSILSIPSSAGRQKAFSTCASHITVVSITYGSCIFMYVKPKGSSQFNFSKSVAILNTVVSPFLNPFIYCLRNKQVQDALRAAFKHGVGLHHRST
ncbi:olfactory receptor 6C74-like [Eublepharis macularius]|uniref:Olfactory receptor n=1 Tax=Eublepharis macularius TaxID=481883 RepID=A0AA97K8E6_EUBMA|nr:olfactory receptor 6C74-like [Eublepharis macularius]